ncbi:hypothetical protein L9F63_017104, partial [Diploptera punctata]
DYGVEGIVNRCEYLKTLSLSSCYEVTDVGILKIICNCKKLQMLELERIKQFTGIGYLDLVPTHLPLLKRLNLCGCRLTIPQVLLLKLVAAMPQLEVINPYGSPVLIKEDTRCWIHSFFGNKRAFYLGNKRAFYLGNFKVPILPSITVGICYNVFNAILKVFMKTIDYTRKSFIGFS